MGPRVDSCARARLVKWRKHIPYIERQVAKLFKLGLRRCVGQNKYGIKINPVDAIERESEFLVRHRFPRVIVIWIADEFGKSPFWEKKTAPDQECCKKFCNAQWVVCIACFY